MAPSSATPLVLISHVSKDKPWLDLLRPQLDVLAAYGEVKIWDESEIRAGNDLYAEVVGTLRSADIVICLISADYLVTMRQYEEFEELLERRETGQLHLLPFLVRPCPWECAPWLKRLKRFPPDDKPLSMFDSAREDELCAELAREVRLILDQRPKPDAQHPLPVELHEDIERLPETGAKLFGRRNELAILDAAWRSTTTNVVSLIAWGGAGKTTLVNRWLQQCRRDGYYGAKRVFGWSFHSQGAKDQVVSSDLFYDTALRWFGAEGFERLSLWDKAESLAARIRTAPTLLVLDGIEPLQSNADFDRGMFRDVGLRRLLLELARDNSGLCVVSSRLPLTDLADFATTVKAAEIERDGAGIAILPATPPALQIDLDFISPDAGRALLKTECVRGDNEELEQATRDFGCHALAVSLLAAWLHEIPGHHVSERWRIQSLDRSNQESRHVRRILVAYEELLANTRELELLRILGLFDRPASGELVSAVLAGASIPGMTSRFTSQYAAELGTTVQRLRDLRLLAQYNRHRPDEIDCHPLIREYFAAQLSSDSVSTESSKPGNTPAWVSRSPEDTSLLAGAQEAHRRLFVHLGQSACEFPDNLREMMPLYQAVQHGCKAGHHSEAFVAVYHNRIQRGPLDFATRKLGAFTTELATLSCFFDHCWDQPSGNLALSLQAHLLNEVGMDLRALGLTEQALEPMRSGLIMRTQHGDWLNASAIAGNISELQLVLGNPFQSKDFGSRSVGFADRSADPMQRVRQRATLADALHYSNEIDAAERTFIAAEELQKSAFPHCGLLWSVAGYRYCDLRLSIVVDIMRSSRFSLVLNRLIHECERVHRRATKTLSWVDHGDSVLDKALDRLTLGRASLIQKLLRQSRDFEEALDHVQSAIAQLRHASILEFLVRGLLLRAELYRERDQKDEAARDLREAETIAHYGAMRLSQVDIALEYVRWHLSFGDQSSAVACWNQVDKRIKELNFARRHDELVHLQQCIQAN